MSSDNSDFECDVVDSGASNVEQVPVSSIKVGSFVLINDHSCKVIDIKKYKVGKHGHAKAAIKGVDIYTGKTMETHKPTHSQIGSPIVKREVCKLINIEGNDLTLLMSDGNLREDLTLPEGTIGEQIIESFNTDSVKNGDSEVFVTLMLIGDYTTIIDSRITQ